MKAVVLCAGRGTRLGSLTAQTPKPLLPIQGQPLITYTMRWLASAGVTQLYVNLHYQKEQIQTCLGDGSLWGVSIHYLYEPELLGTAGTVRALASELTEPFLVVYGDNLIGCSLSRFLAAHKRYEGLGTIALFKTQDVQLSGIAVFDGRYRIRRFIEKPSSSERVSPWINAGLLVWEPEILSRIPPQQPCDFSRDCIPEWLAEGLPVYGYRMGADEPLLWIDTPERYAAVQHHPWVRHFVAVT